MPYDPENPPERVRGLSPKEQRQWCHVANSCLEKYGEGEAGKCDRMAWGVTGGWKEEKGFDPNDPDRDILLEMEVLSDLKDEELDQTFGMSLKGSISEREIENALVSDKLGFPVEIEGDENAE